MATQRQRDEKARALGFRNYLDYRNFLSRQEGYRNYYEQRQARRTGRGLKGRDRLRSVTVALPPDNPSTELDLFNSFSGVARRFRLTGADFRSLQRELLEQQLDGRLVKSGINRATREVTSRIQGDITQMTSEFPKTIEQLYEEGFRNGLGQAASLPPEAIARIKQLQRRAIDDAKRAALGADRSAKSFLPKLLDVQTRREGLGLLRREGIRAVVFANGARRSYEDWVVSSMRANAVRAANEGLLKGAAAKGVKTFQISDGKDCGLTSHRDGQTANGMVVDLETALAYPLAHPGCVRRFTPLEGSRPQGTRESFAQKAAAAAKETLRASAKASLQATLVETAKTFAQQRGLDTKLSEFAARSVLSAKAYASRLKRLTFQNVVDIRTGKPVRFRAGDLADDITTYADDFAAGRNLPAHVRSVIGVDATAVRKVVGDAFEQFHEYYDNALKADLSVSSGTVVENLITDGFRDGVFSTFYDLVQDRTAGRFVRFSAPRLGGGSRRLFGLIPGTGGKRRPRLTADLFKWARVSTTISKRGPINHLSLNPHGLLRAGFTRDAAGAITPSFRLVPPGPIRVVTKVNRATDGSITSLSVELRVITPKSALRRINEWTGLTNNGEATTFLGRLGLDFGASLNVNMRQLGLKSLRDFKDLSIEDWKKLRLSTYKNPITDKVETHPAVQIVSLATRLRLSGFSLFDLSKTFRIKWEDAVDLWRATSLEIETQGRTREYLAQRRRRRIYKKNTGD